MAATNWSKANRRVRELFGLDSSVADTTVDSDGTIWRGVYDSKQDNDQLNSRRSFSDATTRNSPLPQAILRIVLAYVLGTGIIVRTSKENTTLQRRIDNLLKSKAEWFFFCKRMITAMTVYSGVAIQAEKNDLRMLNIKEITGVIRDKSDRITHFRRIYKTVQYDTPKLSPQELVGSGDTVLDYSRQDMMVDIPSNKMVIASILDDPWEWLPFGGLDSMALNIKHHVQSTNMLPDRMRKSSAYGIALVMPGLSPTQLQKMNASIQASLPVDSTTGERSIPVGGFWALPSEPKPFSFDLGSEEVISMVDEHEKQVSAAMGISPTLMFSSDANLATALAQQGPTQRNLMLFQNVVSNSIKMAVYFALSQNDGRVDLDSIEVDMPDPVSADQTKLSDMLIKLYSAKLISREEALSWLHNEDKDKVKKEIEAIEKEKVENVEQTAAGGVDPGDDTPVDRKRPNLTDKHSTVPNADV